MAQIQLNISDTLLNEWIRYSDAAGLSLEAMIQEAATHSVRSDRLGVEQSLLDKLLRETRQAELLARKQKASNAPAASGSKVEKEKSAPAPRVSMMETTTDDMLDVADVPDALFDETSNAANLDLHVPRDV